MGKALIWLGKKILSFNKWCKCTWNGLMKKMMFKCSLNECDSCGCKN